MARLTVSFPRVFTVGLHIEGLISSCFHDWVAYWISFPRVFTIGLHIEAELGATYGQRMEGMEATGGQGDAQSRRRREAQPK